MCVSRWVYAEAGWARIAALAPAVVACAQDGDQVAHHILQEGVSDLVTTVQAVVKQLNMLQPFQLVLAGGMQLALACSNLICWGSFHSNCLQEMITCDIFDTPGLVHHLASDSCHETLCTAHLYC